MKGADPLLHSASQLGAGRAGLFRFGGLEPEGIARGELVEGLSEVGYGLRVEVGEYGVRRDGLEPEWFGRGRAVLEHGRFRSGFGWGSNREI